MLSAREVAAILSVPERTVHEKWRDWQLPAYRIGKHLRWKNAKSTPGSINTPREAKTRMDPAPIGQGPFMVRKALATAISRPAC
jgi:excisionase family DNA binding protein